MDIYSQKPWLKCYDKHVPPTIDYPEKTFLDFFMDAVDKVPKRVAVYYMGAGITFKQLDILTNKFAHYLKKCGLKPGETVGVNLPNLPAYYIALLGIQKAGGVLTGISPLLQPKELEYQLNDAEVKVLLAVDILYGNAEQVVKNTGVKSIAVTGIADFLPAVKRILGTLLKKIPTAPVNPVEGIEVIPFMDIVKNMPQSAVREKLDLDAPMLIQYTGGTTGSPKGAVLTQRNMSRQLIQAKVWMDLKILNEIKPPKDNILSAFPLFHQAGLALGMLALAMGYTQIAIPNPRDQDFIIAALKKYQPVGTVNVPTVYLELMKKPEFRALDFSNLEWCLSGAAPFPPEYIREFEKIVGQGKLVEVLGMTETSPLTLVNPLYGTKKAGSVGIPFPDTEAKLVDADTGELVPQGEPGEFVTKGPQVFTEGYYKKPDETAKTLRDDWIYTGDVCTMDEDGYFYVVDRVKDMVNVSGYKVFSRQVDDVLVEHPDIDMAATIGLPDPNRPGSEIVASAIVLNPGVERNDETKARILDYMKEKMASYKVPKRIEFYDVLPMTGVGKILKRELRDMMDKK